MTRIVKRTAIGPLKLDSGSEPKWICSQFPQRSKCNFIGFRSSPIVQKTGCKVSITEYNLCTKHISGKVDRNPEISRQT